LFDPFSGSPINFSFGKEAQLQKVTNKTAYKAIGAVNDIINTSSFALAVFSYSRKLLINVCTDEVDF